MHHIMRAIHLVVVAAAFALSASLPEAVADFVAAVKDAPADPPAQVRLYRESRALIVGPGPQAGTIAEAMKARGFEVETLEKPAAASLGTGLPDFLVKTGPDARVVVWFSGFADAGLSPEELAALLEVSSARHVLTVVEACVAGDALFTKAEAKPAATLSWSATLPGRQFITHCRAGGGSAFADAFVAALDTGSAADVNKDGLVTTRELAADLARQFGQDVGYGTGRRAGFANGDLVFLAGLPPPPALAEEWTKEGAASAHSVSGSGAMPPPLAMAAPSPSIMYEMGRGGAGGVQKKALAGQQFFGGAGSYAGSMAGAAPGVPSPPPLPAKPAPMAGDIDREKYRDQPANPVHATRDQPVSTFSIDVDTAAYANVRRYLRDGTLPPRDAVRIEEMVNYFDYAYPKPKERSIPFQSSVAVMPTPWNAKTRLLHIGIKGYDLVADTRPRANLVFLLDVSGSMSAPDRLPLLRQALRLVIQEMRDDDTVAIVTYAGNAGTALEPTSGRERSKILAVLETLESGGSTAGGQGIEAAYTLAERNFDKKAVNRVILGTDGDFNVGVADPKRLEDLIAEKRKTGVYLSIMGFGRGNLNDALMQRLAQAGNGNAAYIDSLQEARKVLVDEMAATLFTIADDVKIQVEFNPARVAEYRLIGYETRLLKREDFANDQVDAGEVGSGHTVTALYEITPPGSGAELLEPLRYGAKEGAGDGPAKGDEFAFLRIRYKLPGEKESRLMERPVTNADAFSKIEEVSVDGRFAAAVAGFAQLLRGDPYTKEFGFKDALALAHAARGDDAFGYRAEFVQLIRAAEIAKPTASGSPAP